MATKLKSDWKEEPLSTYVDIKGGNGFPLKFQDKDADIAFLKVSDLGERNGHKSLLKAKHSISKKSNETLKAKIYPANSIIFAKIGAAVFLERKRILSFDACIDNNLAVILPSSNIDVDFLYYLLNNYNISDHVTATALPSINIKDFLSSTHRFPEKPEQQAIAKALSDIDSLIEQISKELIKQTNLFTSVSEELLNPQHNTEVKFQSFSLGKLGTTFGGLNGKSGKDFGTGSEYVTFLNVMNNLVLNPATVDYVEIAPSEVQNKLRENDLVFNGSSETPEEAGLTSVVPRNLEGSYLNSFCFGFRFSKIEEIDPKYFALLSRSSIGRQIIGLLAQGSTRYNISKTELLKVQWPIPDIDIQRKTVEILSEILSLIENTKLAKAKYEWIKQGMAHDLLTGKVRLV